MYVIMRLRSKQFDNEASWDDAGVPLPPNITLVHPGVSWNLPRQPTCPDIGVQSRPHNSFLKHMSKLELDNANVVVYYTRRMNDCTYHDILLPLIG